jgi:succinate-semialdehyde dehydrogenase/glutarate-semialdehyde dehydrogenase
VSAPEAFVTVDPSTGKELERYPLHDASIVESRLAQAASSFEEYRRTSFAERSQLMLEAASLLESEAPAWAELMTREMGKTFVAAKAEVTKCVRSMRFFAEHAEAMLAEETLPGTAGRGRLCYEPLGPILAIMPWNFPLWQVLRFAVPSLMAGNVILLKHAPNVTGTALEIESLFRRAGYGPGALAALLVDVEAIPAIISDERVAAVTLTGSDVAGASVASNAGRFVKKVVLELGGSDPFVVMPSCDLERAVAIGVEARMQNNGQSCIAAKRFIVHEEVYDHFQELFVAKVSALRVGDPMDQETDIGPLASEVARSKLASQVIEARERGALAPCEPVVVEGPGFYYRPGVLTEVSRDMRVWREEVFGPVAVLSRVASVGEAVAAANDTAYGLGASVWTSDEEEQQLFIRELQSGMVFVNEMVSSMPEVPFGGIKRSGLGRELGPQGIRELCALKTLWAS